MDDKSTRPLILRILTSKLLAVAVFALLVCLALVWAGRSLSGSVMDKQAQFVADSVRRSAVQCYAIEGRFPPTVGGVEHLEKNYGLAVDHTRYVVYYESLGDNLIPQIKVALIEADAPIEDIADTLGMPDRGGSGR
jgi:hypothetical protein